MLNQLWNMALIGTVTYGLFALDPFEFSHIADNCHLYKPLFAFLSDVCYLYVYTGMFFFSHLYFQLYSITTLRLMDSPCFQQFYHSKRLAVAIILLMATVNHAFFFFISLDSSRRTHLLNLLSVTQSFSSFLSFFCVYNGSFFHIYLCSAYHYHIYAFNGILKKLEVGLKSRALEEVYVVEKIVEYALLSEQLNELYAVPAIIYLIFNIFNVVLPVCMIFLCQVHYGHLFHGTCTWMYIVFLVYLNNQNIATIRRILLRLSTKHKEKAKSSELLLAKYQKAFPATSQIIRKFQQNVQQHRSTFHRYQQMDIYLEYYQINIFNVIQVTYGFIFKTFLFMLNYIVLITQTN